MVKFYFRLVLVLLAVQISSTMLVAQQTDNWYFGSPTLVNGGLRISFTSGSAIVTRGYPIRTDEGSSSISDASGNPLFYTDGLNVYDASTNIAFATGLNGGKSSTQSAIIMPKPGNSSQWLLFTSGTNGTPGLSYYTITGVSATSGPFTISGATPLIANNLAGEGQFIIGSTMAGSSFWVISRMNGATGEVRAFDVSNTGVVNTTAVSSTLSGPSFTNTSYTSKIGTIKSNTCQNKLAFTYLSADVDIVDFNTATGAVVTNTAKRINVPSTGGNNGSYGIEFSTNDSYLYITNLAGNNLSRYDISANTVNNTFGTTPWPAGQLQAAPDGKIYMGIQGDLQPVSSNGYLGVITNPSLAGATFSATGLLVTTLSNPDGFSYWGLPTFPKSLVVSNPVVSPSDATFCANTAIPLSFVFAGSIDASGVTWTYTGGGGTFSPSTTSLSPSITFTTTGVKTVTVSFNDACGRPFTDTRTYTIVNPSATTGTISCSQPSSIVLTSPDPNAIWYDAAVGGNILGVGSPVTLNYGSNGTSPATVWVIPGTSVSTTTTGTNVIVGPAPSWLNGSSYVYSTQFNVLSDQGKLNSFVIEPRPWPVACPAFISLSFTIEIRNAATTLIYSLPYVAPAGTYACGSPITIPVGADLPRGNGYTISLASFTSNASSWYQIFNGFPVTVANVASNTGPTTNYTIMGNLNFTSKNFTVVTSCVTRTAVNKACTLPVEWLDISASRSSSSVLVKWSLASQVDNQRFEVQRSLDGINFTTIGVLPGKGTSSAYSEYEYVDYTSEKGRLYYRVIQVDYNGTSSSSAIVSAESAAGDLNTLVLYPNPTDAQFAITYSTGRDVIGTVLVKVLNSLGQEVYVTSVDADVIASGLTIDASSFSQGAYLVKVTTNEGELIQHLIKQ